MHKTTQRCAVLYKWFSVFLLTQFPLNSLYKRHGDTYKAMKLIAIEMGRSRTSIRDKLRALLSLGDGKERYVGTWSKSDDRKLIEIVNSLCT